ncbi:F-box domain protein, partial [Ostertagia ostertagi]
MPKRTAPSGNELKEERRTKRRRGRFSELEDDVCETAVLESAESLRVSSPTPTKDYFPWRRLPQELKVKILQYLRRIDLYKCRLLNRDTCNLIRRNIKLMKKRIIGSLEIEPWTFYDKEGRMFIKIPRYLPKALKNSVVRRLEIEQVGKAT